MQDKTVCQTKTPGRSAVTITGFWDCGVITLAPLCPSVSPCLCGAKWGTTEARRHRVALSLLSMKEIIPEILSCATPTSASASPFHEALADASAISYGGERPH